ncbi:MAG: glycosyltransferase [Solirubrobacteraceae bacterium]
MRDLLVTTHTPVLGSGQAMRTYGVARALAAHRGLDLLYLRFGASEPDQAFRSIRGIALHELIPSRGAARMLSYGRARARGVPIGFARGISPELQRGAARMAGERGRGRVIADGPIVAAALSRLSRRRPVIYNAHNLESAFRAELSGAAESPEQLRKFERTLLAQAAESWMVSETDLAGARELCPQATLRYVPNVLDVAAIAPVDPSLALRRALFVANFAYEPNRAGLRFLLEDVMPRVWQQLPDARLALLGGGLEQAAGGDARIETMGFVEELGGAYASASCAVVPLLQGGGTPFKLIEALSYGLPAISTSRGAGALGLRNGEHCLVADSGEEFAAALVRVLHDGAPELARAGRELVLERYSVEALSSLVAP